MPVPKRLLYPADYIIRDVTRLQVQLRRLRWRHTRGGLTKEQLRHRGTIAIQTSYREFVEQFDSYVTAHGLTFGITPVEPALQRCQTDAILDWHRIVDTQPPFTSASETCEDYQVFQAVIGNYWQTPQGLLRRTNALAQYFTYRLINHAVKIVGPRNGAEYLYWADMGDANVCEICQGYARGGHDGYYRITGFLPDHPAHLGCRCLWEIWFIDPFQL